MIGQFRWIDEDIAFPMMQRLKKVPAVHFEFTVHIIPMYIWNICIQKVPLETKQNVMMIPHDAQTTGFYFALHPLHFLRRFFRKSVTKNVVFQLRAEVSRISATVPHAEVPRNFAKVQRNFAKVPRNAAKVSRRFVPRNAAKVPRDDANSTKEEG